MRVRGIHASPRINWRPDLWSEAANSENNVSKLALLTSPEASTKSPASIKIRDRYEDSPSAAKDLNRILSGYRS